MYLLGRLADFSPLCVLYKLIMINECSNSIHLLNLGFIDGQRQEIVHLDITVI